MDTCQPLLTAGEVAEILRVSEPTVRNLRRRGELRYARIGGKVLFRGVDVDAYVESKIEGGLDEPSRSSAGRSDHETERELEQRVHREVRPAIRSA